MTSPSQNPLDRFRLDDKVVVITGASSGLGAGFARATAAIGATLVPPDPRCARIPKFSLRSSTSTSMAPTGWRVPAHRTCLKGPRSST